MVKPETAIAFFIVSMSLMSVFAGAAFIKGAGESLDESADNKQKCQDSVTEFSLQNDGAQYAAISSGYLNRDCKATITDEEARVFQISLNLNK